MGRQRGDWYLGGEIRRNFVRRRGKIGLGGGGGGGGGIGILPRGIGVEERLR